MSAPQVWFFFMLSMLALWSLSIHKWPKYFWQATNVLAWAGTLAYLILTGAPQWIMIGASIHASIAIPLSFALNGELK